MTVGIKGIKVELTDEEKKKEARLVAQGIRSIVCPVCGTVYTGKYLAGIVKCGNCLRKSRGRKIINGRK